MQDRFKFRVWDKVSKRYFFLELKFGDNGYHPLFIEKPIFEQCTGLKDKNGKLIYEGDILNSLYKNDGCKGLYVVVWRNGSLCVDKFGNHQQTFVSISLNDLKRCEVIGNIHENADLLENKDEFIR